METALQKFDEVSAKAQVLENGSNKETPESSQQLLENLSREQDKFSLSMRIAKIAQIQLIINNCESISAIEQEGKNHEKIPQHTEALKRNLDRLDRHN